MSLLDAIKNAGLIADNNAPQAAKKRYSEILSSRLATEVADGLRSEGFPNVKPERGGPGERAFQGGLGPKKVDVSYANEQHGLLLAVSVKTISFAPFGKNLKNRFADLCTEAITLHMRFPYSVVYGLFAFPVSADEDITAGRMLSTFKRATKLLRTISGREEYTDPGEKFENITMLLYQPVNVLGIEPWVKLFNTQTGQEVSESSYFSLLRDGYNKRNPHAVIGDIEELF